MKKDHKKKLIAPITIAVVFIAYLVFYWLLVSAAAQWHPLMGLLAVPLIALGVGMIYTLKERIKEIRSGEEDDLDNY